MSRPLRILKAAFYPAAFLLIVTASLVQGATPSSFTLLNPQSCQLPAGCVDLNGFITTLNGQIGSYLAFNNASEAGNMSLPNPGSWTANGTTGTTMTSLGPSGAHTTIQNWLTAVDNNGNIRYIPAY